MTNHLNEVAAVILAAGRGSRIKAKTKNKVAFKLGGTPLITRTLTHLKEAGINTIMAVVGFQTQSVRQALGEEVTYVTQSKQLGTGDALKEALPHLPPHITTVLSVYGDDSAFYPATLYQQMVAKKQSLGCDLLFLTINKKDPTGLGRIVRDASGQVQRIVEEKNASDSERAIHEVNTGFYCFNRQFLENHIHEIKKNALSQEYYLTDLVEIALHHGQKVEALFVEDDSIWHGVNNRSDIARAQGKMNN